MRAMKTKKRGPVQAPFCQLTPQNQNTVEVVFRPPREANIFICRSRVQVGCQRRLRRHFEFIPLKRWELGGREPLGTDGGSPESYKISQMRSAAPPFFGRRRKPKHVPASRRQNIVSQLPMAARMAEAMASLNRCTSASCSASTITRASGSVPE